MAQQKPNEKIDIEWKGTQWKVKRHRRGWYSPGTEVTWTLDPNRASGKPPISAWFHFPGNNVVDNVQGGNELNTANFTATIPAAGGTLTLRIHPNASTPQVCYYSVRVFDSEVPGGVQDADENPPPELDIGP